MEKPNLPLPAQMSMFPTDSEADFWRRLNAGEDLDCPCCKRYSKIYTRHMHAAVAVAMIKLYRLGGASEFVHTSRLIDPGMTGAGDFSKGKYWKLLEAKESTTEDKRTSGFWRLTPLGVAFVQGKHSIRGAALIFDDKVMGYTDEPTSISEALGKKFSYADLMST